MVKRLHVPNFDEQKVPHLMGALSLFSFLQPMILATYKFMYIVNVFLFLFFTIFVDVLSFRRITNYTL